MFGSVVPVAKTLLSGAGPVTLAGMFYLGAGIGMLFYKLLNRNKHNNNDEAPLCRNDIPWLILIITAGGVIAPILLLTGLTAVPAGTASLLLNGELVMTALIAVIFFHEPLGKRSGTAIIIIVIASLLLSFDPNEEFGITPAAILIIGACVCWGIDNNATGGISAKDPVTIVIIKGIGAGIISLLLACIIGEHTQIDGMPLIIIALIAGFLGYGVSILFFVKAIRTLGAARTGALFATAPFIGMITSLIFLSEIPNIQIILAFILMVAGVIFITTENHIHIHRHMPLVHNHRHTHNDGHHTHTHLNGNSTLEHAHMHSHEQIVHIHEHMPDIHHIHEHLHEKSDEKRI